MTIGHRLADYLTDAIGSWRFIFMQCAVLIGWLYLNDFGWLAVDPYPHTLLNLALSIETAFTAPCILMSRSRQAARDRAILEADFHTSLHELQKLDAIEIRLEHRIENDVLKMTEKLTALIQELNHVKQEVSTISNSSGL